MLRGGECHSIEAVAVTPTTPASSNTPSNTSSSLLGLPPPFPSTSSPSLLGPPPSSLPTSTSSLLGSPPPFPSTSFPSSLPTATSSLLGSPPSLSSSPPSSFPSWVEVASYPLPLTPVQVNKLHLAHGYSTRDTGATPTLTPDLHHNAGGKGQGGPTKTGGLTPAPLPDLSTPGSCIKDGGSARQVSSCRLGLPSTTSPLPQWSPLEKPPLLPLPCLKEEPLLLLPYL